MMLGIPPISNPPPIAYYEHIRKPQGFRSEQSPTIRPT